MQLSKTTCNQSHVDSSLKYCTITLTTIGNNVGDFFLTKNNFGDILWIYNFYDLHFFVNYDMVLICKLLLYMHFF